MSEWQRPSVAYRNADSMLEEVIWPASKHTTVVVGTGVAVQDEFIERDCAWWPIGRSRVVRFSTDGVPVPVRAPEPWVSSSEVPAALAKLGIIIECSHLYGSGVCLKCDEPRP